MLRRGWQEKVPPEAVPGPRLCHHQGAEQEGGYVFGHHTGREGVEVCRQVLEEDIFLLLGLESEVVDEVSDEGRLIAR